MAVYGLHGALGSSKTWGAVLLAYLYYLAGYHIWSDIPLNPNYFPDYIFLDDIIMMNDKKYESGWDYLKECAITGNAFPYKNIYMLLDEWQYHSDSRMSRSEENIVYSYLFIQSRKRGLIMTMTSKDRGMIELRDRDSEDISIKCTKHHNTPDNLLTHNKKCFDHECELRHYFKWLIVDVQNKVAKEITIANPEPIFPLYDTTDLSAPQREIDGNALKRLVNALDVGGSIG